jgi:hypothetical protein
MIKKGKNMNEQNYASLEASKCLHDVGITLETDFVWYMYLSGEWNILPKTPSLSNMIPSPSMAEMWRELKKYGDPILESCSGSEGDISVTVARFYNTPSFSFVNPTDALVYLLAWKREKFKNDK